MTVHQFTNAASGNYKVVCRGDTGELFLYGAIGADLFGDGVTAAKFAADIRKLNNVKTLHLRVNSEGGDVFSARSMQTLIAQHKAHVIAHVDGLAASAASFVIMGANEIRIAKSAFLMIHNAWTVSAGNAADLRASADLLDAVDGTLVDTYSSRSKQDPDKIRQMMRDETWMDGPQAVALGFADTLVDDIKVAACVRDPSRFRNLPAALRPNRAKALSIMERK